MSRSTARALLAWIALLGLSACSTTTTGPDDGEAGSDAAGSADADAADAEVTGLLEPAVAKASGYVPVVLHLAAAGVDASKVERVTFGGIRAFDLTPGAGGDLSVTIQGYPGSATVPVVVTVAGVDSTLAQGFRYEAPSEPKLAKVMAFGASETQGVQNGVPTFDGARMSSPAQLAQQLGVYLPLPLPVRSLMPQMTIKDLGPAPGCAVPSLNGFLTKSVPVMMKTLVAGGAKPITFAPGRVDPDLAPGNIAVGNSALSDIMDGISSSNPGALFLGHLVNDPHSDIGVPPALSELQILQQAKPTLVISLDMYGNDVLFGITNGETIDVAASTPSATLGPKIAQMVDALAAIGAETFIASLPRASLLPAAVDATARTIASGVSAEEVAQRLAAIDAIGAAANAALVAAAAKHDNVHVVDLFGFVEELHAKGIDIGGQHLTIGRFGGLVSLDGLHFSHTGYALVANLFLAAIDEVLGTQHAPIELAPIVAADPLSPKNLQAAGLSGCQ